MVEGIRFRRAEEADIGLLARHHRQMFEEMRGKTSLSGAEKDCCAPLTLNTIDSCCSPTASSGQDADNRRQYHLPDFKQLERSQSAKLKQQIADGSCLAWIAEYRGKSVASGAVSVIRTTPVPEDSNFEVAFLHSVYCDPSMRGRGVASMLVDRLLDDCRDRGLGRVLLNASEAGRSVYQRKGFSKQDEAMICWL